MKVLIDRSFADRGPSGTQVYVDSLISLNHRPAAHMIDPAQDLTQARVPWLAPAPWMLPMKDAPPGPGPLAEQDED